MYVRSSAGPDTRAPLVRIRELRWSEYMRGREKNSEENLLTGPTWTANLGSDRDGTWERGAVRKALEGKLACFCPHRSLL